MQIADLEKRLLASPFDIRIRKHYAASLSEAGRLEEALEQWRLVTSQEPGKSGPLLEAARCCEALGKHSEASTFETQAQACDDYLQEPASDHGAGNLVAFAGGRSASAPPTNVVSISAASSAQLRFDDVVGMDEVKKTIRLKIIQPFLNPGLFQRFKKRTGGGVLLYGPPGCGKTMIARAIAGECRASFTAVGISDILNMWIGESERNLAAMFEKARDDVPCVLFFDELDALAYARSKSHSDHTRSIVNEFLGQLDGMSGDNERVLVLGATNMPWDVDEAMKRPGRFDRLIFVPPPDAAARAAMLDKKLLGVPTEGIDTGQIAAKCANFSGADLDGLIDRAKEHVLSDILESGEERPMRQADMEPFVEELEPTTLDWLKTSRNLVKFGGGGRQYKDVEKYLRQHRLY